MNDKYNDLLLSIDERVTELSLELKDNNDKRVEYLDEIFEKYSIKNPIILFKVPTGKLLLALLFEADRKTDASILKDEVEEVLDYLNVCSFEKLLACCSISQGKNNQQIITDIEEKIYYLIEHTDNKIINCYCNKKLNDLVKRINDQLKIKFKNYEEILIFFKLARILSQINKQDNLNLILFSAKLQKDRVLLKKLIQAGEDDDLDLTDQFIASTLNKKIIEESLSELYDYYRQIDKQVKNKTRDYNKKIYRYAELKKILDRVKDKQEITSIDAIMDKIADDDIKKLCLEYIYEHNMQYYTGLYDEYSYKNENSINKYITYFSTLGINFIELSHELQEKIMKISLEIIKEKNKKLSNLPINNNDRLIIISESSLLRISDIDDLIKSGYIDIELLTNNLNIYYNDKDYENFVRNINILEQEKINIKELSPKNVLLVDNDLICTNISLLQKLGINIRGLKDISMLSHSNLSEQIESLIEVNLEAQIINQPQLLNSDKNLAKRILVSRYIGEEIYDNGLVKESIVDKDQFFVADSNIDSYLFDRDNSEYNSSLVISFNENEGSKFSYDIEGIRIPKAKVSNLSVSLQTLVRTSLYSKEEIKKLEKHGK